MSVDPLSSQGVHLALQSGIQSAAVINTILNYPKNAALAQQFYRDRVDERVAIFSDRSSAEYRRVAERSIDPFWISRGPAFYSGHVSGRYRNANIPFNELQSAFSLSPDVAFVYVATIDDNCIKNSIAIEHPNLDRPIAFFSGCHLPSLLTRVSEKFTRSELFAAWSTDLDASKSDYLANWLWQNGLIISEISPIRKIAH
jgi:hypothetical protein